MKKIFTLLAVLIVFVVITNAQSVADKINKTNDNVNNASNSINNTSNAINNTSNAVSNLSNTMGGFFKGKKTLAIYVLTEALPADSSLEKSSCKNRRKKNPMNLITPANLLQGL